MKATMMARRATPAIPPAIAPTRAPVLIPLDVVGGEVCIVIGWERIDEEVVVVNEVLEDGGGVVDVKDVVVVEDCMEWLISICKEVR